jgi:hypothetical protein
MVQPNRWHPVMLPDDYLRRLKQDLAESDEHAVCATRLEPDPEPPDDSDCDESPQP